MSYAAPHSYTLRGSSYLVAFALCPLAESWGAALTRGDHDAGFCYEGLLLAPGPVSDPSPLRITLSSTQSLDPTSNILAESGALSSKSQVPHCQPSTSPNEILRKPTSSGIQSLNSLPLLSLFKTCGLGPPLILGTEGLGVRSEPLLTGLEKPGLRARLSCYLHFAHKMNKLKQTSKTKQNKEECSAMSSHTTSRF